MKKPFLVIALLCAFIISSFAQTITWKKLASLPEGLNGGEAVSLNNEIYFVAGRTKTSKSASFYKLNPIDNQWIKLADVPDPATNIAMATVNGKIYVIGGDLFKNTNREYDPKSNSWKLLKPMPTGRQHINCGVYENEIYIAGGLTSWKNITKNHEVFNTATNTWSEKAAIPYLVQNASVVTIDSLIYVIGGAGAKEDIWADVWTVETYNINTNKWEKINELPQLLFGTAAVVMNKEIIVLGGQTLIDGKNDTSKKVFIYKTKSGQWIETSPLPIKNVFFACATIGNKIYVIGGTVGGNPSWDNYAEVYEGEIINK
jgi:N-acetylneuraminic acid mutarotase